MNYILLAIPFFWLLIAIEVIYDLYRKTGFYRINDFVNSINAGIISRMNDILRQLVPLAIYAIIEKHFAMFNFNESIALWIVAFILYDFCYYWKHRIAHEINFFWAAHVVHHSSEEYNLSTALRQSSTSLLTWIFYVPMALMGIDPLMLVVVGSLNLIYQFWVHTRFIPKLGFFEWIFITPSNHRVHHAMNDQYIDKNYGGVFILWDRFFGTFQQELEDEACVFGIRKPLHSWNPLWMNVHFYAQLIRDAWHTKHLKDKFLIWIKPTGWRPEDVKKRFPLTAYEASTFKKFNQRIPTFYKYYVLAQLIILLVIVYVFLLNLKELSIVHELLMMSFVIFSSTSFGAITEGHHWAKISEYLRYSLLLLFAHLYHLSDGLYESLIVVSVLSFLSILVGEKYTGAIRLVNKSGHEELGEL